MVAITSSQAKKRFEQLSLPENLPSFKNENYRYTKIKDLILDRHHLSLNTQNLIPPELLLSQDEAMLVTTRSSQDAFQVKTHSEEMKDSIQIQSLENPEDYPSHLTREDIDSLHSDLTEDVFVQMVLARARIQNLIYVPKNTTLKLPLRHLHFFDSESDSFLERTVLFIDKNSEVTFIDEHAGTGLLNGKNPFCSSLLQVHVEENSKLNLFSIQHFGTSVQNLVRQTFQMKKNASIRYHSVQIGGLRTQTRIIANSVESGADFQFMGAVRADHTQHFDHWIHAHHAAKHTRSDVKLWSAVADESTSVFNGTVKIPSSGSHTAAYQRNYNLLLSKKAQVHSLPKLEIATDEVQCAHGATISPLDENQLFYLRSRGIPKEEAEHLLIQAFTAPVVQKFPNQNLIQRIDHLLKEKHESQ